MVQKKKITNNRFYINGPIIVDVSKIKYGNIKVGDWVELTTVEISLASIMFKKSITPFRMKF